MYMPADIAPPPASPLIAPAEQAPAPRSRARTRRAPRGDARHAQPAQPFEIAPDVAAQIDAAEAVADARPRQRRDGWTGTAQRIFLEAIAAGDPVDYACRRVGMTRTSAYAFRSRPHGAAFAAAWDAAADMARFSFGDYLMQRVIEGVEIETRTMKGEFAFRRHFDHRLAVALLNRMDRQAEARAKAVAEAAAAHGSIPRDALIARHWAAFLDMIEQADTDDRDSDEELVSGFVSSHQPEPADADMRPLCQLHPSEDDAPATPADIINGIDYVALDLRVSQAFRQEADGTLATCLGTPAQITADDDPYDGGVVVPEEAWRPATAREADIFHAWQMADRDVAELQAREDRNALLADMRDFTAAVSLWSAECTARSAAQDGADGGESAQGPDGAGGAKSGTSTAPAAATVPPA